MKIKRINRTTGEESFVSLDYAVSKIAFAEHLKPATNDKQYIMNLLISGTQMWTCEFIYKKVNGHVNVCGNNPLARFWRLTKDFLRDVDTANF